MYDNDDTLECYIEEQKRFLGNVNVSDEMKELIKRRIHAAEAELKRREDAFSDNIITFYQSMCNNRQRSAFD